MRKLDKIIIGSLLVTVGMLVGMYYTIPKDTVSKYSKNELEQRVYKLENQQYELIYVLEKTLPSSESIGTLYEKYKQQEARRGSVEPAEAE